ncbi:tetratricopeptide repeat protein [Burkholderia cepacia]|uniref:Sel1 repeat family protein n=1 Tax=Burkholderia cepacia TaxID=292 RepID=A0AA88YXC6_BURCE|nr:tetratricopeptide repeat protein [Burkholderia cepacia]KGB92594.1 sel1 repeat family protein [Burkholderia cepacia]
MTQSDTEAFKWYRLAAEQGDANAQNNLGLMYENGQGVRKDDAEAARWYRLAAAQGAATSLFRLGVQYYAGSGVASDPIAANALLSLAAAAGETRAQQYLDRGAKLTAPADIEKAARLRAAMSRPGNLLDALDRHEETAQRGDGG